MDTIRHTARWLKQAVGLCAALLLWSPVQAYAQAVTEVRLWHTLHGPHRAELEALVAQFNRESPDVKVVLTGYADLAALQAAETSKSSTTPRPHLVQLPDNHTPEVVAEHRDILPLYQLLASYPIADLAWFLPQTSRFVRDARGRLLAFPYMAEAPLVYYNLDAWQRAGLAGQPPARTWPDLQGQLAALRAAGTLCPYLSSQRVTVHLEALAPVNRKPYLRPDNGLTTKPATLAFDTLHMRHLSLMVSWQRAALLTHHSPGHQASVRFAQGDCGVLMAGSAALAELRQNPALRVGVAPLPYYPLESDSAAAPFVGGSALWALAGHSRAQNRATAALLAWLAKPVAAARWHQNTGFLPLTHAAYRAAQVSFYQRLPGAQAVIESLRSAPATSQGFRLRNYPAVVKLLEQGFDRALSGAAPPVQVLKELERAGQRLGR